VSDLPLDDPEALLAALKGRQKGGAVEPSFTGEPDEPELVVPTNGHKPDLEDTVPHPADTVRPLRAPRIGSVREAPATGVPPHDLQAEELVLGSMMIDAKAARGLFDIISIDDFYLDAHRKIAECVLELLKRDAPTDPLAVWRVLVEHQQTIPGGPSYLAALTGSVTTVTSAPYHATAIAELSARRQLIDAVTIAAQGAYESQPLDEVIGGLGARMQLVRPGPKVDADKRPEAVDVVDRAAGREADDDRTDHIVAALWRRSGIVILTGEEGDGKTILAEQLCRELLRGERPLGFFELGDIKVGRVLFVDTEMEDPEIDARCAEMDARGLGVDRGQMFWTSTGSLDLAHAGEHRSWVEADLEQLRPDVLWIDSGGNAVDKPKEDESVKPFFNWLSELIRRYELKGIGLTVHPRKRDQENKGRRFDDLFGSREWKGRASKALYVEGSRITAWKDRGGGLRRLWPPAPGRRYPQAILDRPGFSDQLARPFAVTYRRDEALEDIKEQAAEAETKIIDFLREQPDQHTKSGLAKAIGLRKAVVTMVVDRLIENGMVGPAAARSKLRILADYPDLLTDEQEVER
jgi:DnaB-like helicase N terminal domain/AAA domain